MNAVRQKKIKGIYEKIERIKTEIEELYDDEQTALNNMPESFENTKRYAIADNAVNNLDSAILKLEEALEYLEKVKATKPNHHNPI
jgi:hypothetical protein